MAHKLITLPIDDTRKTQKKITLPQLNGKFGFAVFIGGQEIFLGIAIAPVEIERIIKKRFVKTQKAKVKVLQFD